ncbi:hypothetical protein BDN70DRAFT_875963 [Pholiota conissans]|uniref:Uncharacterized protein n=1 Tax=Pholiota conissans TaxID=109636 RepID=A0A9P5Z6D7_9AGAR|nr:hypothetical protein BDN70DRAFT_875963 [Pholiota conissans]
MCWPQWASKVDICIPEPYTVGLTLRSRLSFARTCLVLGELTGFKIVILACLALLFKYGCAG